MKELCRDIMYIHVFEAIYIITIYSLYMYIAVYKVFNSKIIIIHIKFIFSYIIVFYIHILGAFWSYAYVL